MQWHTCEKKCVRIAVSDKNVRLPLLVLKAAEHEPFYCMHVHSSLIPSQVKLKLKKWYHTHTSRYWG